MDIVPLCQEHPGSSEVSVSFNRNVVVNQLEIVGVSLVDFITDISLDSDVIVTPEWCNDMAFPYTPPRSGKWIRVPEIKASLERNNTICSNLQLCDILIIHYNYANDK